MQSPINTECRNPNSLNYYTCISTFSNWDFWSNKIENNIPLNHYCFSCQANAYHHRRCTVEMYAEKSTSQSFQQSLETHYTTMPEKLF